MALNNTASRVVAGCPSPMLARVLAALIHAVYQQWLYPLTAMVGPRYLKAGRPAGRHTGRCMHAPMLALWAALTGPPGPACGQTVHALSGTPTWRGGGADQPCLVLSKGPRRSACWPDHFMASLSVLLVVPKWST